MKNHEQMTPTLQKPSETEFNRVYAALQTAAHQVAQRAHSAQYNAHLKRGRKASTYRYQPTEAHTKLLDTLRAFCYHRITPEEAMAVLHEYDVMNGRFDVCQTIIE